MFDNSDLMNYVTIALVTTYIACLLTNLPMQLFLLADYTIPKIILLVLILYYFKDNAILAVLLVVAFFLSLQKFKKINEQNKLEPFDDVSTTKPTTTRNNNSDDNSDDDTSSQPNNCVTLLDVHKYLTSDPPFVDETKPQLANILDDAKYAVPDRSPRFGNELNEFNVPIFQYAPMPKDQYLHRHAEQTVLGVDEFGT